MQLSIFNLPALRRFSMGLNRTRTIDRFECIQAPRNKSCWWAQMDSNHRPISLRDFFEISKAFGRFSFFEPTNKPPCTTSSHPLFCWWAQMDSNHRPISLRDFFEISKAFGRFSFFEPTNKPPCTTSSHPLFCWWAQMDSNHRPHAYQACALTN